jgi:hypothetical protein
LFSTTIVNGQFIKVTKSSNPQNAKIEQYSVNTLITRSIPYAKYNEADDSYYFKFTTVLGSPTNLIKSFSKLEDLTLTDCKTNRKWIETSHWNGYHIDYVTEFTYKKVKWKLEGQDAGLLLKNKKNIIEKAAQAALEAGKIKNDSYLAYIYGVPEWKIYKWFKKHPQFALIKVNASSFQFVPKADAETYAIKQKQLEAEQKQLETDAANKKKLFADVNEKVFRKNGSWFYTLELDNVDLAIETKEKYPDFILNLFYARL